MEQTQENAESDEVDMESEVEGDVVEVDKEAEEEKAEEEEGLEEDAVEDAEDAEEEAQDSPPTDDVKIVQVGSFFCYGFMVWALTTGERVGCATWGGVRRSSIIYIII